ncbi:MAG: hypothetical protein WDW36_001031 [Sanguina aurantia]
MPSYGTVVPTTCQAVPGGCGKLGGLCCPPRANNRLGTSVPFCYDAKVVCTADAYPMLTVGKLAASRCQPLLLSPNDCGGAGKPCCPLYDRLTTDKLTPRECVDGSSCGDGSGKRVCTLSSTSCGTVNKPCCKVGGGGPSGNGTPTSGSDRNRQLNGGRRSLASGGQGQWQSACQGSLQCVGSAPDEGTCLD